ncbi:M23 family metallopeptidase [Arthrobacter sp. H20]|uniref:M23 family metallopeptidase n=1 Tax=Arthrobacter sp. H20 TaxID=1267981 RepID=UPI0004BAF35F|nr:M23 family metallopeptidase [Arthrobacter sp. H20]
MSVGALAVASGVALTAVHPGQQVLTSESTGAVGQGGAAVAAPVTAAAEANVDFTRESPTASASEDPAGTIKAQSETISETEAFAAPLAQAIIASPFGYRVNPMGGFGNEQHTGTDYAGACGTPVLASRSGSVVASGWHAYGGGQRIVVDHGGGIQTSYNHLSVLGVTVGDTVGQGQELGAVGSTGNSTGCHLHFELLVNGEKVDPQTRL